MNRNKKLVSCLVGILCVLGLVGCKKHEHTFATEWSKDANNHWHAATCEHVTETADKAAHTWNAGEVTTPATHTQDGVKTFTCTVCGQTKTESVAKGTHEWGEGVVTTPATCTEAGVMTFTCTCGETKTEAIGKLAHVEAEPVVFHFHYELKQGETYGPELTTEEAIKDLIVTETPKDSFTVTNMSKVYGEATSGSNYSTFDVLKFGSSKANGTLTFGFDFNVGKVIVKGAAWTDTDALTVNGVKKAFTNKLNGTFNYEEYEFVPAEETKAVAITAEKRIIISELTVIPAGVITNEVAATCTENGSYDHNHICAVCGAVISEPTHEVIEATGHTFDTKWTSNNTHHWHAATCGHEEKGDLAEHTWNNGVVTTEPTFDAAGVKTYTCTVCGATKTEAVEALDGTVEVADGIKGGTVTVSSTSAKKGTSIVITPVANTGYTLTKVFVEGVEITPEAGVYAFDLTVATAHVNATFTRNMATESKTVYDFTGKVAAEMIDDGWVVQKYTDAGWTTTSATLQAGKDYAGNDCGVFDAWDNGNVFAYSKAFTLDAAGYKHLNFVAKGNGITTLKVKLTHNADDMYKGVYVVYDLGKLLEGWATYSISVEDPNWQVKFGAQTLTVEQVMALNLIPSMDEVFSFFDEISFVISGTTSNGAKSYTSINGIVFDVAADTSHGTLRKNIILYNLPEQGKYVSELATLQMTNQQMTKANLTMGSNTIAVDVAVDTTNNVVTLKDETTGGTALTITGKFVDGGNVVVTKVEGAMATSLPSCVGLLFFDAADACDALLDFEAYTTDMDWKPDFVEYRKYGSSGWTDWTKLSNMDTVMRIRGKDGSRVANFSNGYSTTKQIRISLDGKALNNLSIDLGNYYSGGQVIKFKISLETTDGKTVYVYGDSSNFAELAFVEGGPMVHYTKTLSQSVSAKYVIITAQSAINGNAYLYLDNLKAWFGAAEQPA